ncbi:MAG: FAD-binding protein, partial [Bacteroidales bacterium]|nr:FAD-binding protein [Bacteroidales bacterium]
MQEALATAKNCRHYAMCKIDFLGSGVCASGTEKHYVGFYPQGRMDLYAALAEGKIPVTEKCFEIADTCDLCGQCDYQCYFVTEMRPTKVMKALKDHVATYLEKGGKVVTEEVDEVLLELRKIVGDYWATSDRAIALTYAQDPSPITGLMMPDYVIMPNTKEEISAIVKLLNRQQIPFAVRGNGSSVMGFVMSPGAVLDMNRMKTIEFDEKNWLVKTGAGVAAFDLQKEAQSRGYRVNVAEPSALVCANIMCSGIFSTFSATYGTAADNYIDAQFVTKDGDFFKMNDKDAPNLFAFNPTDAGIPAICTSADIKLHPIHEDETGLLI